MSATATRIMKSMLCSKCRRCGKWIGPGEKICFTPGAGATHLTEARCAEALPSIHVTPMEPSDPTYHAERERVGRLLEAHPWTFAKTMPEVPHWWTVRRQWDDAEFTWVVLRIKQLGVKRKFRKSFNYYFDFNRHAYWTMDPRNAPAEVTTLINRAVREDGGG
jgi:hypothetical protein